MLSFKKLCKTVCLFIALVLVAACSLSLIAEWRPLSGCGVWAPLVAVCGSCVVVASLVAELGL